MKVREIMTPSVRTCFPETNLAHAATLMWDSDCGVLPVISGDRKVLGVITDRDICMAAATKGRRADEILVAEVIGNQVFSCRPEDEVHAALKVMKDRRVRRVPVTDAEGRLEGVLSMNDLILAAHEGRGRKGVSYEDVVETLKAICGHRLAAAA
jgi:CBS domain-containing protein